jgi:hypothetical protein
MQGGVAMNSLAGELRTRVKKFAVLKQAELVAAQTWIG